MLSGTQSADILKAVEDRLIFVYPFQPQLLTGKLLWNGKMSPERVHHDGLPFVHHEADTSPDLGLYVNTGRSADLAGPWEPLCGEGHAGACGHHG